MANQQQNNENQNELIITRGVRNAETKTGRALLQLFLDTESAAQVMEQLAQAIETGEDGVRITVLQGEDKNGKPFAMVGASGLEKREESERPKKAYTPPSNNARPAQNSGGYKPKTPGYSPRGNR